MKVSTLGGKPLITGGKVVIAPGNPCPCGDCGSGGGGGGTGACCKDGVCTVTTPAGCDSIGGHYQGNGTNCEKAICACSDPDPPVIVVRFEDIVLCPPCIDGSILINGEFELPNFASHQWGGGGGTIICDGDETNTLIVVTCNSGNNNFQIAYLRDGDFTPIFEGAGLVPLDNTLLCVDVFLGEGGTASITLP